MTLSGDATLVDVAFAVCTVLDRAGVTAVLCGGSAATYYAPERYQSLDADFVLRLAPTRTVLDEAMARLGYLPTAAGMYAHPAIVFTVEFPRGPLAIGRDIVTDWSTQRRGDEVLYVTAVTDCIRDRFMHFWAWNDRSALEAALAVARRHRSVFDDSLFRAWTAREMGRDRSYRLEKVDEFFRRL
jgi:hypothetical protein